jgi:Domain of unknown function (DUF4271)
MINTFLFVLSFILQGANVSQVEVADLSTHFKVYTGSGYVPADSSSVESKTLFLFVDAYRFKGNDLRMESDKQVAVFINGALVEGSLKGVWQWDIDSLAHIYSSALSLAIYREGFTYPVKAEIVSQSMIKQISTDPIRRESAYFSNFCIVATLLLSIGFVLLLSTNSRLTLDYFNFIKLFSMQERDENLLSTKIPASFNLLVYTFACFLLAYLLLVMNHYSGYPWSLIRAYRGDSTWAIAVMWLNLSVVLSAILLIKLIVVYSFSKLFDFRETLAIQFFSFIRLIFLIAVVIILFLIIYMVFEVRAERWYGFLFYLLISGLILWIPIAFLKLMGRSSYRMFHLFSYLCPSEVFPILVLIKALYF